MPLLHDDATAAEALFASHVQPSQRLTCDQITVAITATLRNLGRGECAAQVAQEFGDHPENAIQRMRWACEAIKASFASVKGSTAQDPGAPAKATITKINAAG